MLLSIIVPIYNAEKHLAACIESILRQHYQDFELYLINDGSSDLSLTICQEYASRDSRIKIFSQENRGAAEARNVGISLCKGEVVGFVDADDYLKEDMYQQLMNELANEEVDIVCGSMTTVYPSTEILRYSFAKKSLTNREAIQLFLKDSLSASVCDKVFRRRCFPNYPLFPKGLIGEDHLAVYTLFKNARIISLQPQANYYYRQTNIQSITKKTINDSILNMFDLKEKIMADVQKNFPQISTDFLDAYFIPSAIYTMGRMKSEKHALTISSQKVILHYYRQFRYKALFNPYVSRNIRISSFLLIIGFYTPIRHYLRKRK